MSQKSWVPTSQPPAFEGIASRSVLLHFPGGALDIGCASLCKDLSGRVWYEWYYVSEEHDCPKLIPTHWMDLPEPPDNLTLT